MSKKKLKTPTPSEAVQVNILFTGDEWKKIEEHVKHKLGFALSNAAMVRFLVNSSLPKK